MSESTWKACPAPAPPPPSGPRARAEAGMTRVARWSLRATWPAEQRPGRQKGSREPNRCTPSAPSLQHEPRGMFPSISPQTETDSVREKLETDSEGLNVTCRVCDFLVDVRVTRLVLYIDCAYTIHTIRAYYAFIRHRLHVQAVHTHTYIYYVRCPDK